MNRKERLGELGYEILLDLKRGGMGDVMLARRRGAHGFERLVALKTLRGELSDREELRAMFRDEAALLSRLSHPAVTQAFDLVDVDGELCLVFEYVAGVDVRRLLELSPPPLVSARVVADALRGLHAAHELADEAGRPLEVVHRDVSPDNLMITFEGQVKILDFGIAWMRRRGAPQTELGVVKGKPQYMAPEQLRMERVDRRTDVFAASLVLHELLTGRPVFVGDSPMAVALEIAQGSIAAPSATAGPLPEGLDQVVLRGLARSADARFPTAAAMADALDEVLRGAGGDTLESFARRALTADREKHEARLRAADGRAPGEAEPSGRPTGMSTLVERPREAREVTDAAPVEQAAGRRGLVVGALVAVTAVTIGGVWWRSPGASPAPANAAALEPSTATPQPTGEPERAQSLPPATVADAAPPKAPRAPSAAPSAPALASRSTAPAAPAPTTAATVDPSAQPDERQGFLSVGAEPYALVQLDGASIGPTPIFKRKVAAGSHRVVLVSPDTGEVRLSTTVVIEPGATRQVVAR